MTCGTALFGGICAALLGRERTGKGDYVTISLFGGAIWIMSFMYLRAQQRYGGSVSEAPGGDASTHGAVPVQGRGVADAVDIGV